MAVLFTFSFNFSVLLPLLAQGTFHGGAGTYGSLLSLMGAGSLVGALAMARRNTPSPKRLALWAIGFGLVSMLSAVAPTLGTEMVVLVPLGLVAIAFMITANSTLQLTARPEMRGRVMALYSVVFLGGTPIGAPIAGFIAQHLGGERLGPRVGIALGALIAIAAGSIGLRALARLGTPSALGAEAEVGTTPVIAEPHLAIEEALTA
jgi:MFS family permease